MTTYLLDTSVWTRTAKPTVVEAIRLLSGDGDRIAACVPVVIETLKGVPARDYDRFADVMAGQPIVRVHDGTHQRALGVQRMLAQRSQHKGPSAIDLIVAAAAEEVGAVVVHYDRDFDTIAEVTGQATQWIVPAGTAD